MAICKSENPKNSTNYILSRITGCQIWTLSSWIRRKWFPVTDLIADIVYHNERQKEYAYQYW